MIPIQKNSGPRSLQEYAANGYHYDEHTSFTDIKQEIREHLCEEQGYICCYCMRRINPDARSMQIAHIENQADHRDLDCQYSNMLGSCSCGETCNQKQKEHDLKYSPEDDSHSILDFILFETDGTIKSTDPEFDIELEQILNLNSASQYLKQNRAEIYKRVKNELKKTLSFNEKKAKAHRLLDFWQSRADGKLREYCGVAIWYLEKQLQRWDSSH